MGSILILLHCESNTGYAIGPLEGTFFQMARLLCDGDVSRIHFGYPSMRRGPSDTLPADFNQYLIIDPRSTDPVHTRAVCDYLRKHGIDTVFGFDQPVHRPMYRHLRAAGVRHFIAYWGAPMSSIFGVVKRTLKRLEVALLRHDGPDHYIFESQGMADTAVLGRGIPRSRTSIVYQCVDADRFRPNPADAGYVYEQIGVPAHRRIFFYAGHFEERKGVAVIMRAANRLAAERKQDDWHIVLFGNQPGEEKRFEAMLSEGARTRVTFGGYRPDMHLIQRGCYAAVIASTGWDSFPRSGMEMQASGLPLLVSDLLGLRELVSVDESGYRFPIGDDAALAAQMNRLFDDEPLRNRLSQQARARVERDFSLRNQIAGLVRVVTTVVNRRQ